MNSVLEAGGTRSPHAHHRYDDGIYPNYVFRTRGNPPSGLPLLAVIADQTELSRALAPWPGLHCQGTGWPGYPKDK